MAITVTMTAAPTPKLAPHKKLRRLGLDPCSIPAMPDLLLPNFILPSLIGTRMGDRARSACPQPIIANASRSMLMKVPPTAPTGR